ncbi:MAG: M48 family metallopeptidase, partial [Phycisphaerales bacterium]|nr:M48 family metallopeptidase [Phycisphaerales bacterium]
MAMKFREHQALAKRNTKLLILLMTIGALVIFTEIYLVANTVYTVIANQKREAKIASESIQEEPFFTAQTMPPPTATYKKWYSWTPEVAIGSFLAVSLLIGGVSWRKISEFSKGGKVVATMLGARRVRRDTTDPCEKVLLNIVDEMSLASGVPAPPVYVLPERGINAFAAGYTVNDAVVAVTEGTFEHLSRDELQGVVAHEFSHILSGDMRLNIRLTGMIAGILAIALIGQIIFRMAWYSGIGQRSSKDEGGARAALMAAGLALWIIGALGALFGTLIKFAICRQREYLADASAVQFTRYPAGLRGALAKISGASNAGHLEAERAGEFSHFYFTEGVSGFGSMMATHPP